jgi:hypothetical protein
VIVPDGGSPESIDAVTLEGLMTAMYPKLVTAKAGWCYVYVKGQKAQISHATQFFQLKLPDGSMARMEDPLKGVFDANNRFNTLQSRSDSIA